MEDECAQSAADKLAAYGEQFLMCFSDDEPVKPVQQASSMKKGKKKRKQKKGGEEEECVVAPEPVSEDELGFGALKQEAPEVVVENKPKVERSMIPMRGKKKDFMSGNIGKIFGHQEPKKKQNQSKQQKQEDEEEKQFDHAVQDLLAYVLPKLGARENYQYQDAKIRALGGNLDKQQKCPYPRLKLQRAKQKREEEKTKEREKELGVTLNLQRKKTMQQILTDSKKLKKEEMKRKTAKKYFDGVGHEKKGMLKFNKATVKKYADAPSGKKGKGGKKGGGKGKQTMKR